MIFFSDMDGTFLTSDKRVSEQGLRALDELAARGIELVPCTGRALSGIPAEVLSHPAVHHAVSSNGATVSRIDRANPSADAAETLRSVPLSRKAALAIWELARDRDVTFDIFADGHCYLRRDILMRLDEFVDDPNVVRSMTSTRTPVDEEAPATLERVGVLERIAMYWRDERDRDDLIRGIEDVKGVAHTRSWPTNIEVMDERASKGTALAWLCDRLGIPASEAVAFGDNMNDISMFKAAGTGIAMANAEDEARAAADATCPSNDEGGVGTAILELLER